MSPLIPPLFPPLLPRRRLCHCPSCIDVPASITILLAAAVCVVPLMLLPMPPRPPIAFHDGTLRLPLLIPPIPPPSAASTDQLSSFAAPAPNRDSAGCCCIDPTALPPASGLVASAAAYDSAAISPPRFCFDEDLKLYLLYLCCSFCLRLCCHRRCRRCRRFHRRLLLLALLCVVLLLSFFPARAFFVPLHVLVAFFS